MRVPPSASTGEKKMDKRIKVIINEKEYDLKYTLESWKKLKSEYNITPSNFQEKLEEDMAGSVSAMVFYGLSPADRERVTSEEIDGCLEFSVVDIVSKAVIAGLPKRVETQKGADDNSEKK